MMPTVNPVERFGQWFTGAAIAGTHTWVHYKVGHLLGKGIAYGLK